jgi:prevent-host-death family protein
MKATAKDLRFYAKELLESANRGESITISYRGKPYAKLVPIENDSENKDETPHTLFGIWSDHGAIQDIDEHVRQLRKGRNNVG